MRIPQFRQATFFFFLALKQCSVKTEISRYPIFRHLLLGTEYNMADSEI